MQRFYVLAVSLVLLGSQALAWESRMVVRIELEHSQHIRILDDMHLDFASHAITDHADVVVTPSELTEIQRRGFRTEIIQREEDVFIPSQYHTVAETWAFLDSLHELYPEITELDTCGYSQRYMLPMPHFIISHNIGVREDEPAALLDGMHHAREPIGNEICLYTMRKILEDYPDSVYAQRFVDSMELHFVPIVNTEGWQYITDSSLIDPWWRKNLRDNGNNGGPINPDSDGVDLNRNYDWRWTAGGSPDPTSWVYRGPSPASESEVQALVSLSTERKFVVGISYHSYGGVVMFPWAFWGQYPPDINTLNEIANAMASLMSDYYTSPLDGSNMSSTWCYGQLGTYDFLIETAISFIPPPESISIETEKNFKGIAYLLERSFYSGVTGHVRDSVTLQPLEAVVEVTDLTGDTITPRTCDNLYGRFYRLLQNGTYTFEFSMSGYTPKTISNIVVTSDSLTQVEVLLSKIPGIETVDHAQPLDGHFLVRPNPFYEQCLISAGSVADRLSIYDVAGRLVRTINGRNNGFFVWDGKDKTGQDVAPGVYCVCGARNEKPLTIVKIQ